MKTISTVGLYVRRPPNNAVRPWQDVVGVLFDDELEPVAVVVLADGKLTPLKDQIRELEFGRDPAAS